MKYVSIETKVISVLLEKYSKALDEKQCRTDNSDYQASKRSLEIVGGVSRSSI